MGWACAGPGVGGAPAVPEAGRPVDLPDALGLERKRSAGVLVKYSVWRAAATLAQRCRVLLAASEVWSDVSVLAFRSPGIPSPAWPACPRPSWRRIWGHAPC